MTGAAAPARAPAAWLHLWLRILLACAMAVTVVLASASGAVAVDGDDYPPENLLNNDDIMPGEDVGPHPIGRYLIVGDDTGLISNLDNILGTLYASFAETAWTINRWMVRIGLAVFEWAYSWDLIDKLTDPVVALANSMDRTFIGRLRLRDFALFLAIAWSGYHLYRRRTGLALSELLISLLVAALGALLVANPAWLLESFTRYALDLSTEVITLVTADEDANPDTQDWCPALSEDKMGGGAVGRAVRPLARELHCALIGQPYDIIAWGQVLDGTCAGLRDRILREEELHPASDKARDIMRGGKAELVDDLTPDSVPNFLEDWVQGQVPEGPCAARAEFNERWTTDRLAMAWISTAVTLTVVVLLGMVALTILAAQFIVAAHVVFLPFAVMVGTVPGTGRQLLLRWGGNVLQAGGVIIALSFLLALFLRVTTVLLSLGAEDASVITRYLLLLVAVFMIFRARKRLVTSVQYMSIRAAERLQTRNARGEAIGVASRGSPVFGLEVGYAVNRARRMGETHKEEYFRNMRREVEEITQ